MGDLFDFIDEGSAEVKAICFIVVMPMIWLIISLIICLITGRLDNVTVQKELTQKQVVIELDDEELRDTVRDK